MRWFQRQIELPRHGRGMHLVTRDIVAAMPELERLEIGLLNVFLLHTSASLTINENASPDVRDDLEDALSRLAPEDAPYRHADEGPDDMPAHVKTTLTGCSLTIPVTRGKLALGTWQGIYLCEHRDGTHRRSAVLTLQGHSPG